jgi:hypothetical protein
MSRQTSRPPSVETPAQRRTAGAPPAGHPDRTATVTATETTRQLIDLLSEG